MEQNVVDLTSDKRVFLFDGNGSASTIKVSVSGQDDGDRGVFEVSAEDGLYSEGFGFKIQGALEMEEFLTAMQTVYKKLYT